MNICIVLDQFVDNSLRDTHGTSNTVKYPGMLIKLIYISFLRRLHGFTFHEDEEPPRFLLDSRKLSNVTTMNVTRRRKLRHFAFLVHQIIKINTVWLLFVELREVPCLYHHCQQSLLNWHGV